MKLCKKCNNSKDLVQFYKCKTNKDGLRGSCKECMDSYCVSYVNDNKDKVLISKRKYFNKNKDLLNEKVRQDTKLNPGKRSKYTKKWKAKNVQRVLISERARRAKNPDKCRENDKRNRTNNKGTKNSVNARRRAFKLNALLDSNKYKNELKLLYTNCPDGYEVDHIVPLVNSEVCGLHVPWNLQYLTGEENRKKSNKLCQS